jgi:hypothetical protein
MIEDLLDSGTAFHVLDIRGAPGTQPNVVNPGNEIANEGVLRFTTASTTTALAQMLSQTGDPRENPAIADVPIFLY